VSQWKDSKPRPTPEWGELPTDGDLDHRVAGLHREPSPFLPVAIDASRRHFRSTEVRNALSEHPVTFRQHELKIPAAME
jgi:hypothetical protein